jgi:hypothetical protein
MNHYFLNISEEEKKSIRDKQRSIYDGYQTMEPKMAKETPLYVENLALDEKGVTLNNKNETTEYKHTGINKPIKKLCKDCGTEMKEGEMCEICEMKSVMNEGKTCEKCGKELAEGKMCECAEGMKYSMEEIEESIKIKSKKGQVYNQINESLDWFRKFNKYL